MKNLVYLLTVVALGVISVVLYVLPFLLLGTVIYYAVKLALGN